VWHCKKQPAEQGAGMSEPVILCDIGNVLVAFDFTVAARRCAEHCPFPADQLFHRLDMIKGPYEGGEMDDAAFVQEAMTALEFQGSCAEFQKIWCEIFTENKAMQGTLTALSGKLPMFLLSNTSGLHKDYLFETYSIFRLFQGGVYSYSARCSKPGSRIFELTAQQLKLDPQKTLYIDDLEANVATARELGFKTHLYDLKDHQSFERDLQAWLSQH